MTKVDLIDAVSKATGLSKKASGEAVEAVFDAISSALAKGEKVQLVGFGTFEVRNRAARQGRNPQNPSQVIKIPAKAVPAFRPGKALREAVDK
ncbi:HU family DNA-binding protein [Acetomicrobium sp. S15 = DSM 107314]|uniref:HU family DNA-binding protein n=1 Tax=Acetomicrobium sp. S15 = DSM 107314 TaxID=2529858 RepID=UPI0018E194F0|nr:HU family DNA-binding protein [Acetomicrobium sp. S15 = DSM 107314]